jgi:PTH1 family peptidyl-tRNA hydrolase
MKLIVGLGNPGLRYKGTRHNIGFMCAHALAKKYRISLKKEKGIACVSGKGIIASEPTMVAMPLTFMNLSGDAVGSLVERYGVELSDLLVVCDDLDLAFGRMKVKPSGSSAGHHGVDSIIHRLGSSQFPRLRMGIGRPTVMECADYVLSRFTQVERAGLAQAIAQALECIEVWVEKGVTESMNSYNKTLTK